MHLSRKAKLGQLTRRKNVILQLMRDSMNEDDAKDNMHKYHALLGEFMGTHISYQKLLNSEDCKEDNDTWFEPKMARIDEFIVDVSKWLSDSTNRTVPEVAPGDSVSSGSDRSNRSTVSSTATARILAEAVKAARGKTRGTRLEQWFPSFP